MKKIITLTLSLSLSLSLLKADYWTQKANYPGAGREYPFSFTIANKGYVGCGMDTTYHLRNDFWEYDPSANVWTQKANFGGAVRYAATGFSIGNKGYAGLGFSPLYKDFWEYDPFLNTWTQKADFGGAARYGAAGFSVGNFGYICAGGIGSTVYKNIWQYDPVTDTWTQKMSLAGAGRRNTNCFAIGNSGYITGGFNQAIAFSDLWEYNTISNAWTQKANFPDTARCDAAAFSICDYGYFGTGEDPTTGSTYFIDFWQYNPATNAWIQKANFPGLSRDEPAYFSIGSKGYLGAGGKHAPNLYNDFWEYTPDSICITGIEELPLSSGETNLEFTISPNPAKELIVINYPAGKEKIDLTITDARGKKVFESQPTIINHQSKISLQGFSKGIYFVEISDGKQKAVRKFVKE